jgi:hypothetical protein
VANNRVQIRSAIKALLTGTTSAGNNVFSSRGHAYWRSELPAICIFTSHEPAQPSNLQNTRYNRTLEISIEVRVEASSSTDDTLDNLIAEIEAIMQANPSLSGTVQSTTLTNTDIRVDTDGEQPIGVGTLSYESKYSS